MDIINLSKNSLLLDRIHKMVVGHSDVVEEVYEDFVIVVDKATRDERIGKTCDRNCVAVECFVFLSFFDFGVIE